MTLTVDEIAGLSDPVLRNLWITQRYHELAVQLSRAGAGTDATWCAFAVWASKTAGVTIRGQELPRQVQELLTRGDHVGGPLHRFNQECEALLRFPLDHTHLLDVVAKVSDHVAAIVAGGNLLVFAELAPLFNTVVDAWSGSDPPQPASPEIALGLAFEALEGTGIDTAQLRQAFTLYWAALARPADRAPLMLAGNVLAVAHEQQRLQPAIAAALDAAVRDVLQGAMEHKVVRHLPTAQARHLFEHLSDGVCDVLDRAWQTALTELTMKLVTADESLDLRKDVPPLGGELAPSGLTDLAGTAAATPFAAWDRTGGQGSPTGAKDWAVLVERMNYIATLFRSRQRHPALLDPPFTDVQLAALAAGRLPDGPL